MLDRPLVPADLDLLADSLAKRRVPVMAVFDLDPPGMDRQRFRRQKLAEKLISIARNRKQGAMSRRLAFPHLHRAQAAKRGMRRVMINRDLAQQPALEFCQGHRRVGFGIVAIACRHVRSRRTR